MSRAHKVEEIAFHGRYMLLKVDGRNYRVDLRTQSPRLAKASEKVKRNYVISPSGYGIHWPDLDEDLSIDGMIGSERPASLPVKKRA